MNYHDLLRAMSGFNGLSKSGRHIEVEHTSDASISYREEGDTLKINMPAMTNVTMTDEQVSYIRARIADAASQFLYSEGIHSTVNEWECDESPLGHIVKDCDATRAASLLGEDYKGVRVDVQRQADADLDVLKSRIKDIDPDELGDEGIKALGGISASEIAKGIGRNASMSKINDLLAELPAAVQDKINSAMDAGLINNVVNARTMDESVDAGKKLFEYFFDRTAEEEIQQQQEQAGSGDGDEKSEGQQVAEAMGKPGGDNEGGDGEDEGKGTDHKRPPPCETRPTESGEEFSIGADGYGTYIVCTEKEVTVCDYTTGQIMPAHYTHVSIPKLRAESVLKSNAALTATCRRLLQVRSESIYIGQQKRGKLQRSAAWKIGVPTVGNGDFNSKVWRKRIDSDTLNTVVEILVDFSGSMVHSNKICAAISAATQLAMCLDKAGIACAVTSFSDNKDNLITGIFKQYDRSISPQAMIDSMTQHFERQTGGNPDCCAVHWATVRMSRRPEKRKVLIVMSDGCPAGNRYGSQEDLLPSIVDNAYKYGVECSGIGIIDSSVQKFYKDHAVLKNNEDILPCLTNIIKTKIV